jgi:hypothetical protein
MNNNLSATLKKFSLPIIIVGLGLTMLIIGNNLNQPPKFMMASLFLVIAGLVMLFFSAGSNIAKVASIIGIVLGAAGLFIYYDLSNDIWSIDNARKMDREIDELVKQNLNDIKTSQIAYKELNGSYAKSFDELKSFINNGKIKVAIKNGGVPNRRLTPEERAIIYGAKDQRALDYNMTELEALFLSKSANPPADLKGFVRDTILSSFYESSFGAESYQQRRLKMGFPDFNVDSIFYIPSTGSKFSMVITDSIEFQGIKVQGLMVEGKRKMKSKNEEVFYSFGSTSSPALSSNWD